MQPISTDDSVPSQCILEVINLQKLPLFVEPPSKRLKGLKGLKKGLEGLKSLKVSNRTTARGSGLQPALQLDRFGDKPGIDVPHLYHLLMVLVLQTP